MFVCIGWGSLIWRPEKLPVVGEWYPDGPYLSVEFARESSDKRITLVICDDMFPVKTLWAELNVTRLETAKEVLADREGISRENIERSIGFWSPAERSIHTSAEVIGEWSANREIKGVVWTALQPRIRGESGKIPTEHDVVDHLRGLQGDELKRAEEYVRRAPRQIVTPYRTAIEKALGWTASEHI